MEDTFLISSDETAGYLLPITSYVDSWPQWKDFSPAIQTLAAYEGQVYGVPYSTDDRYLWYNANIFKQAGLAVPWHPTNWAQIMSALETIHTKLPSVIPMNIFAGVPSGEAVHLPGLLDAAVWDRLDVVRLQDQQVGGEARPGAHGLFQFPLQRVPQRPGSTPCTGAHDDLAHGR